MQGASGLARDTYKFVAVSLTLASVCTGLAHIMQVQQHLFWGRILWAQPHGQNLVAQNSWTTPRNL